MPLFDQEHPRARLELFLDQLELTLREPESLDVIRCGSIGIRKEDLCRSLLDDCPTDRAQQSVARALRRRTEDPIELSPDFQSVLGELLKGRIGE